MRTSEEEKTVAWAEYTDGLTKDKSSPCACAYEIKGLAKISFPEEAVGKRMGNYKS